MFQWLERFLNRKPQGCYAEAKADRDRLQELMRQAGIAGEAPERVLPLDHVPTSGESNDLISSGINMPYTTTEANQGKPAEVIISGAGALLQSFVGRSIDNIRYNNLDPKSQRGLAPVRERLIGREILAVATYFPKDGRAFDVVYFPKVDKK